MTAERGSSQARWQHQFSEVDREIMKMASICGVDMLDRTQLRRTLENDSSVCSHTNPVAFEKLHTLLKAHYLLRERAAGAIGEQGTQQAIEEAVVELVAKFNAARSGQAPQ
ncbi:MAG TPA: hypothetical protein VJ501_03990 [Burkholderiaceae bacterium]|nr:hypothetical protein [Burkholderiaceae bacterium]